MIRVRLVFGVLAIAMVAAGCGRSGGTEQAETRPAAGSVAAPASTSLGAVTSSEPADRSLPRLAVADRLGDEGGARQLIVVAVADPTDTFAQLQAFDRVDGRWVPAFAPTTARLGRSGISGQHWEGDGTTPAGVFTLTEAFGNGPDPGSTLPYRLVRDKDYWVSDPDSPSYNTRQVGPPNGRWTSAEALWTKTQAYRYAVVVDYNRSPVVARRGSAIFLHVRNENPTSGCVSIDEDRLVEIVRWLDPTNAPKIAIGTDASLTA